MLSNVDLIFISLNTTIPPHSIVIVGGEDPPTTLHWALTLSQVCKKSRKKTQLLLNCIHPVFHLPDPCAALASIPAPAPMPVLKMNVKGNSVR